MGKRKDKDTRKADKHKNKSKSKNQRQGKGQAVAQAQAQEENNDNISLDIIIWCLEPLLARWLSVLRTADVGEDRIDGQIAGWDVLWLMELLVLV
nr:hypothetical protein BaRGS_001130 [Batillaria attramentaria]